MRLRRGVGGRDVEKLGVKAACAVSGFLVLQNVLPERTAEYSGSQDGGCAFWTLTGGRQLFFFFFFDKLHTAAAACLSLSDYINCPTNPSARLVAPARLRRASDAAPSCF